MEREVIKWERIQKILFSCKEAKMRIAVCDRDKNILKTFKKTIYCYAEKKRMDIVVDCYLNGENVLNSDIKYNIIFLGYELIGKNGLEIAKILRRQNVFSAIIFISRNTNFVLESFKVNPYRFLLLPVKEDELFCVLNEFFEEYGSDHPLWIKSGEDTFCLNTGEIIYLEADNKHCFIHLEDEILNCNRTMARVYEVLPKHNFSKINRAFIVNLNFIKRYNRDTLFLKNGQSLHISRNYFKSFKSEYYTFSNPQTP